MVRYEVSSSSGLRTGSASICYDVVPTYLTYTGIEDSM